MASDERTLRLNLPMTLWGWQPHESQRIWLDSDAQTKVAVCGRRWGKTEVAAVDAAVTAIVRPGCTQMIVGPTADQSRLIFDTVERLLLGSPATRPLTRVVRTPHPRLTVGKSVISARTADDDGRNLRGHSADRVIVDEAAFVRDSVIQEVLSPMLADRNGRLVMVSTPFGKNHFYRAYLRGQDPSDPGTVSFRFPSWANPHISRTYIENQRNVISKRQFEVEYEARFLDDQSSVFRWDEISAAIAEPSDSGDYERIVAGIDWARYTDYTAVIALGVSESGVAVTNIDRFNGLTWAAQIERVADFLDRSRVSAVLTDQTSVGDPLLEQLRARLYEKAMPCAVDGLVFGNQSKRELIEALALRFANGSVRIPDDPDLIRELQYYEYELTQSGNVRMNARSGCHDDLVIALALACRQAVSVGSDTGFLTTGARASGW